MKKINNNEWKGFLTRDTWKIVPMRKGEFWISKDGDVMDSEGRQILPDKEGYVQLGTMKRNLKELTFSTWFMPKGDFDTNTRHIHKWK